MNYHQISSNTHLISSAEPELRYEGKKVKGMQRPGTDAIRTKVPPSKLKWEVTKITISQNREFEFLERHNILIVNEKLPVSKFRYFGKYIIFLDGYFYVHVSAQRHTGLETKKDPTSPGTMAHVIHVLFVVFTVFENLKASFT